MTLPMTEPALSPLDASGPSVVAIGGGHGLACLLEAVQGYAGTITAVVSVADDGGSSGRLIKDLDIPPPGDIRKCLLALAPEPTIWAEMLGHRFERGDVAGHSLGNLMLAALTEMIGDFSAALRVAEFQLGACGRVIPAALHRLDLVATIDGREVDGQVEIAQRPGHVEALRIEPSDAEATPSALEAIRSADQILLAPGSLYTSLIATLVVPGVTEAIEKSDADLIYILNLVTQNPETLAMDADDHAEALRVVAGLSKVGTMVAHAGVLDVPRGLSAVSVAEPECQGWTVITADVADHEADWPQHHPIRLGQTLSKMVKT